MKIFNAFRLTFKTLPAAFALAPAFIIFVVLAEGAQHIAELQLGMYQSLEVFIVHQGHPMRLALGALKGTSILVAFYVIYKRLTEAYGPLPRSGSFRKDFIRKLWDPRVGTHGMMAMVAMVAFGVPLIFVHYELSYFAMGHPQAAALLVLDSLLVAIIPLIMATGVWASNFVQTAA